MATKLLMVTSKRINIPSTGGQYLAICALECTIPFLSYRRGPGQRERLRHGEKLHPSRPPRVVFFEMSKQNKKTIKDLPERNCFQPDRPILFPRSFLHL